MNFLELRPTHSERCKESDPGRQDFRAFARITDALHYSQNHAMDQRRNDLPIQRSNTQISRLGVVLRKPRFLGSLAILKPQQRRTKIATGNATLVTKVWRKRRWCGSQHLRVARQCRGNSCSEIHRRISGTERSDNGIVDCRRLPVDARDLHGAMVETGARTIRQRAPFARYSPNKSRSRRVVVSNVASCFQSD